MFTGTDMRERGGYHYYSITLSLAGAPAQRECIFFKRQLWPVLHAYLIISRAHLQSPCHVIRSMKRPRHSLGHATGNVSFLRQRKNTLHSESTLQCHLTTDTTHACRDVCLAAGLVGESGRAQPGRPRRPRAHPARFGGFVTHTCM